MFNRTRQNSEDARLIRETLSGHPESFGRLVQKYQSPLFDLALRMMGSRAEAEDILQESFVEAYKHLSEFNHQSALSTWLYSIVLNRSRNRLRHNKVLRWLPIDAQPQDEREGRSAEIADRSLPLDAALDQKLRVEAVQKALRSFPAHYQSIFILYYFHNMSLGEVAVKVGRPLATVKVYLHRARALLYRRLGRPETVTLEMF